MCISVAMSAVCCAGSAFCRECCSCCRSCCGTSMKEQIRIAYIFFNLFFWLFVIFVLYYLQGIVEPFEDYLSCPANSGGDQTCLGVSAVYRMSFTLAIMYLVIMICMICRNEFSKAFNEGMWCFKITYVIFAFFGFMFISNSFFDAYRDISKIISMVYIIFQSVIFIEIFYIWGFKWFNRYADQINQGNQNPCMKYILIFTAGILFIGTIVFNILNIIWFKGCSLGLTISVVNIIFIVLTIIIQIIKTGSLIATLANGLYMTYLTFSAQLSGPKENCTDLYFDSYALVIELIISFFFTIAVMFYLTFAKKEDSSAVTLLPGNILTSKQDREEEEKEEQIELQKKQSKNGEDKEAQQPQQINLNVVQENSDLKGYKSNAFLFFHFIMALTSIYSAMLLTNWGSPPVEDQVLESYKPSEFSYWAKIITSWITGVFYIFTIFLKQHVNKADTGGKKYNINNQVQIQAVNN